MHTHHPYEVKAIFIYTKKNPPNHRKFIPNPDLSNSVMHEFLEFHFLGGKILDLRSVKKYMSRTEGLRYIEKEKIK